MAEAEPQGFDPEYDAKMETVRKLIKESSRGAVRESLKLAAKGLYFYSRIALGVVLHPVSTFRATMQLGSEEDIERNFERSLSIPGFKGSGRLRF